MPNARSKYRAKYRGGADESCLPSREGHKTPVLLSELKHPLPMGEEEAMTILETMGPGGLYELHLKGICDPIALAAARKLPSLIVR